MKKLMVVILLAGISTSAMAEWIKINEGENTDIYVNKSSIRRTGNLVKMWSLYNFKTSEKDFENDKPHLSSINQMYYDCQNESSHPLYSIEYDGNMGLGNVTFRSSGNVQTKDSPVIPDSIGEMEWKIACGKK